MLICGLRGGTRLKHCYSIIHTFIITTLFKKHIVTVNLRDKVIYDGEKYLLYIIKYNGIM